MKIKMIDGHTHLEKGPLTREYAEKFIEEAIRKGISELNILDHTHRFKEFEPIYEKYCLIKPQFDEWLSKDFRNSIYEYISLIEEMKKIQYPIKVNFGLEVCYQSKDETLIKKLCDIYPFDFLIGSVHAINYHVYDSKWSKSELWDKYDVNEIYKDYYDEVIKLVKSDIFDIVGHPDTIKMFNYYPSYDLTDTYNELAFECFKHQIYVENNVGCYYRYGHKDMGLSDKLLNIFKEHNCKMITSSDAHIPEDVGNYISEVWSKTFLK